jgi:hypothetical protein
LTDSAYNLFVGGDWVSCFCCVWRAACFVGLSGAFAANAATINVAPIDSSEMALVTIEGPGDIEQFQTKTSNLTKAIVMFGSDGGNLEAGIQIGKAIRLKGFLSLVPDGVRCASACGLAWLGGVKRLMGPSALVGFHAAYFVKDGEASETSAGNALVGAYLNTTGLPDRAVIYITQAAPDNMTWLTLADAKSEGIDVELFTPPDSKGATNNPQPVKTQPVQAVRSERSEPHTSQEPSLGLLNRHIRSALLLNQMLLGYGTTSPTNLSLL